MATAKKNASTPASKPATKSKSKALAPKTTGTNMANLDEQFQNEIANLKDQIGQPSGSRIKVTPAGEFQTPDGMVYPDEIQVVVVDFISRNSFYPGQYNPNNPSPPDCYSMGKVIADLAPEDDSPDKQNERCSTCPMNQFGSGPNGTSKACKNTRDLAVILIDPDNPEAASDPNAPIYIMSLPPTAIKSFDGVVSTIARTLQAPPVKAIVTVNAKPVGTYALITFTDPVPNPDFALHYSRRAEIQDNLFRKPDFAAAAAKPQARGRNAAPARRTTAARR